MSKSKNSYTEQNKDSKDCIENSILNELWESINKIWGGFDTEQIVGSMSENVCKKAHVLSYSREHHDWFFKELWKTLTEEERRDLLKSCKNSWDLE